jgi:hypothetical protein
MDSINLFLQNNPNLLPPEQVRIERIDASLLPGGMRVKVEIDVTPFRERPNLEIQILDPEGKIAAVSSVIATMHFKMEFHLHLRSAQADTYTAHVQLYYDDIRTPQDTRTDAINSE